MAITPRYIYKASEPDPFNILLLGDGFVERDEEAFYEFCRVLAKEFIKIPPFKACRQFINVLAYFTASANDGITSEVRDTYYKIHFELDKDGIQTTRLKCESPEKIFDIVRQIEFTTYGIERNIQGKYAWMNEQSKSCGAVGIIAKSIFMGGTYWSADEFPPYFIFSQFGFDPNDGGYQFQFVHELGHAIQGAISISNDGDPSKKSGLGDEYEKDGDDYKTYPADQPEPKEPNITSAKTIEAKTAEDGSISVNSDHVKWIGLAKKSELEKIKSGSKEAIIPHPNPSQSSKDNNKIVVDSEAILLVEGGYLYRQGIYRSNKTCQMKTTLWMPGGTRTAPSFCKVCRYHIMKVIRGDWNYSLDEIQVDDFSKLIEEKKLRQRLISSLENNVDLSRERRGR